MGYYTWTNLPALIPMQPSIKAHLIRLPCEGLSICVYSFIHANGTESKTRSTNPTCPHTHLAQSLQTQPQSYAAYHQSSTSSTRS